MSARDVNKTWEFRQRPGFFFAGGMFTLFLAIVALAVAALVLAYAEGLRQQLFVIGTAGLGAMLVYTAVSFLKRGYWGDAVIMRIDPKGLWHRLSTKNRVIGWSQIEDIFYSGGLYSGGTRLRLKQSTFKMLFPSSVSRAFNAVNWLTLGPALTLHLGGLDMRPRQIRDLIKSYAAAHGGLRQND